MLAWLSSVHLLLERGTYLLMPTVMPLFSCQTLQQLYILQRYLVLVVSSPLSFSPWHTHTRLKFKILSPCNYPVVSQLFSIMSFSQEKLVALIALGLCGAMVSLQIVSKGLIKVAYMFFGWKNVLNFLSISDMKQFLIIGIICGPILFVWTFVRGDLKMTINFPHLLSLGFIVCSAWAFLLLLSSNYSCFFTKSIFGIPRK